MTPPLDLDAIGYAYSDGGRAHAGFRGETGDCVTRAVAIALDLPYRQVYDDLFALARSLGVRNPSPRDGVPRKVYDRYLADAGWAWTPTMTIGSGTTVHLRRDELPAGRLVVRVSKHLCAVIDGTVFDTHDPSRAGRRAVYGFWSRP